MIRSDWVERVRRRADKREVKAIEADEELFFFQAEDDIRASLE